MTLGFRRLWRTAALGLLGAVPLLSGAPTLAAPDRAWFLGKPPAATQTEKPVAERGANPCNTPDPGFVAYSPWTPLTGAGLALLPTKSALSENGEFDLVIHFHGHEPARKEWVRVMSHEVLVGMTLGVRSGVYETAFQAPEAFQTLLAETERTVSARYGRAARARRVALSAWSAGYGAVEAILRTPFGQKRVDSVLLLDGLHCDYASGGLDEAGLEPFVRFAKQAGRGDRLMVVSHSSIIPPGYASTTETANFLIDALGGKPKSAKPRRSDPLGLELLSRFDQKGFHVLGFSGNGALDHCAHVGLLRDILSAHLAPRWKRAR